MSKHERVIQELDKLTDLCFTISAIVRKDEEFEEEAAKLSTSTLSAETSAYVPVGRESSTQSDQGSDHSDSDSVSSSDQESVLSDSVAADWESVPNLSFLSISENPQPTFSQVVGCSKSVYPFSRVAKSYSFGSESSMANVAGLNYATCTAAQFDAYWQTLTEPQRAVVEQHALNTGSDAVKLAVLLKRDNRKTVEMAALRGQLTAAQQLAQQATVTAATARAATASPPPKWENKEKDVKIRQWIPLVEEYFRGSTANDYLRNASSYLIGKPRSY